MYQLKHYLYVSQVANFPWDAPKPPSDLKEKGSSRTMDDPMFEFLAKVYADHNPDIFRQNVNNRCIRKVHQARHQI